MSNFTAGNNDYYVMIMGLHDIFYNVHIHLIKHKKEKGIINVNINIRTSRFKVHSRDYGMRRCGRMKVKRSAQVV